ncbi:hypothetical protein J2P12_05675, partial [Candidatus Bathyarchaeota archaeon]|nr:hypothetical protein [Candidatus Bathyarchaeota archaeon]
MSVEELTEEKGSARSRVAILGIGGAGNNLLSHAISGGVSPTQCVAVNTDRNQLSACHAKNKILITGNSLRRTTHDELDNVRTLANRVSPFTSESDFTILLTGLGGVMGTMAGPAIAELNRGQAKPVVSIVALPFIHERDRRFLALRGLKRMVESSDCTVVVDNAVEFNQASSSGRGADEIASLAVRSLSEVVAMGSSALNHRILSVMRLGQVATVCAAAIRSSERIQSGIIEALQAPSAELPLSMAKGAVLLYHGLEPLSEPQAIQAYEAVSSLVGHDVEFVQLSTRSAGVSRVSVFLTGYSYS